MGKQTVDNKIMKNRVIGVVGIGAENSNWNADFEGNPKTNLDKFVGSPFALKYAYRNYWNEKNLPLLFFKSYKKDKKNNYIPKSLDDRLDDFIDKKDEVQDIQRKVFKCIDVSCFGGAFASKKFNKSYTGAIQFNVGVNLYEDAEAIRDNVLSPFQNANKEDSKQSTIGSRAYLIEGHFFYDFIINPFVYDSLTAQDSELEAFTVDTYNKFKEASLQCANTLNSVAKKGCYNEFALFIELKEGSLRLVGGLSKYIKFTKNSEEKNVIDLTNLMKTINPLADDIKSVEIYYNPVDSELIIPNDTAVKDLKIENILKSNQVIDFTKLV